MLQAYHHPFFSVQREKKKGTQTREPAPKPESPSSAQLGFQTHEPPRRTTRPAPEIPNPVSQFRPESDATPAPPLFTATHCASVHRDQRRPHLAPSSTPFSPKSTPARHGLGCKTENKEEKLKMKMKER
jgi:hypothetical protein